MTQLNEEKYKKLEEILTRLEKLELHSHPKKSKLSKTLEILEKFLLPLPLTLGILAFVTSKASVDISKAQFEFANQQSRDQLERQKEESRTNVQQKYLEIFYQDINSKDNDKQVTKLSLLSLMEPDTGKRIADWPAKNSTSNKAREVAQSISQSIEKNIKKLGSLNRYKINIYVQD